MTLLSAETVPRLEGQWRGNTAVRGQGLAVGIGSVLDGMGQLAEAIEDALGVAAILHRYDACGSGSPR